MLYTGVKVIPSRQLNQSATTKPVELVPVAFSRASSESNSVGRVFSRFSKKPYISFFAAAIDSQEAPQRNYVYVC